MEDLDVEIESLYRQLHPQNHLRSLPGIGSLLGPSLLAVIHDARRFQDKRKMRGYTGLFPRRSESGGLDTPSQRIVKGGNDRLKRDLIIAADVARKIDPELGRLYYTMMVEKGRHHRQALCAVANRLANRIHAVLKEGRPYVLRDLDGQPISLQEGKAIVDARFQIPQAIRSVRRRCSRQALVAA